VREKLRVKIMSWMEIGGGIGFIVAVQLVILIIWTVHDPFTSHRREIDPINLRADYVCNSNNNGIWFGIEAGVLSLLLLWGIYVVYSTWKIKVGASSYY
jgi:hypothetical protein